jgi:transcriptional regulator with XRE-family HTH domain
MMTQKARAAVAADGRKIGLAIQRARKRRGWSQNLLGQHAGRNQSYISALERGQCRNPSIGFLRSLSMTLGVPLSDLLAEESPLKRNPMPTATEVLPPVISHVEDSVLVCA